MRKTTHGQNYGIQLGPGKLADFDFADDIALLSNTRDALQDITTGLQINRTKVGLRISAEKTKAMIVGEHQTILLTVDQKDIEYVDKFQYLGSYMSRTGDVDTDIRARIGKASGVFRRLHNVWRCSSIGMNTKLRLYTSVVLPTAIYAGETWTSVAKTRHMLDVFNRRVCETFWAFRGKITSATRTC